MMNSVDILIDGLREFGIEINAQEIEKFKKYKSLLKEWNEKINITAIKDDNEIDIKHFLDSLTIITTDYIKDKHNIIDVGTGGGFPGLPLKIMNNNVNLVLLDSLNKRINFLNEVIKNLKLQNVKALHGRAEDYGKNPTYREKFDIATARAVAPLNILCEYCLPFVKVGGYFIAMKGPEVNDEIESSKKAMEILGGTIEDKYDIKLPFTDITHSLVIIKKITNTPTKYPRKAGKPTKKPL